MSKCEEVSSIYAILAAMLGGIHLLIGRMQEVSFAADCGGVAAEERIRASGTISRLKARACTGEVSKRAFQRQPAAM
jgi:hypothetical protein